MLDFQQYHSDGSNLTSRTPLRRRRGVAYRRCRLSRNRRNYVRVVPNRSGASYVGSADPTAGAIPTGAWELAERFEADGYLASAGEELTKGTSDAVIVTVIGDLTRETASDRVEATGISDYDVRVRTVGESHFSTVSGEPKLPWEQPILRRRAEALRETAPELDLSLPAFRASQLRIGTGATDAAATIGRCFVPAVDSPRRSRRRRARCRIRPGSSAPSAIGGGFRRTGSDSSRRPTAFDSSRSPNPRIGTAERCSIRSGRGTVRLEPTRRARCAPTGGRVTGTDGDAERLRVEL